jgi:uncharacterized protein YcgI (DUF1989 family)
VGSPFEILRGNGLAFAVLTGQVLRIGQGPGGGQVGDVNAWNLEDPRETFYGARTAGYHGMHVTKGDQLWSTPPGERPMFTILEDTVARRRSPRGALQHDVLLGRCSRKIRLWRYGSDTPGCQELLAAAIEPFGLRPEHVHNAFNAFMYTGIDADDRTFFDPSDALETDYLDLRAEIDCLVAISACPGRSSADAATGLVCRIAT